MSHDPTPPTGRPLAVGPATGRWRSCRTSCRPRRSTSSQAVPAREDLQAAGGGSDFYLNDASASAASSSRARTLHQEALTQKGGADKGGKQTPRGNRQRRASELQQQQLFGIRGSESAGEISIGRISARLPRRRYQELQESQIKSRDVNTRKVFITRDVAVGSQRDHEQERGSRSAERDRQEVECLWLCVQYCSQSPGGAAGRCVRSDQDMSDDN